MGDLLGRLGAIAAGDGPLVVPRPRARFEPVAPDEQPWTGEQAHEVDVPRWAAPLPPADPATTDATDDPARTGDRRGRPQPAAPRNPMVADGQPRPARNATIPPSAPEPVLDDARETPPAMGLHADGERPDPAPVIHERETVREVHTREVARTERIERGSEIVELIYWIEREAATAAASPAPRPPAPATRPSPAPSTPDADPFRRPGVDRDLDAHGRRAPGSPIGEAPPSPEPASPITVTIGRLEVRTVDDQPRRVSRAVEPEPAPLRFAGPTLDEFLGTCS